MEGISSDTVATSKPFKFLVGPGHREFTIHSALVAHQSPVLDTLVNGRFRESHDSYVVWDDIDEKVFASFWQFAYTGGYHLPQPLIKAAPTGGQNELEVDQVFAQPAIEARSIAQEVDNWGNVKFGKKKTQRTKREMLWGDFTESWRSELPYNAGGKTHEPEARPKTHADLFIHHAKVYILADRYGVTRLMSVSFHKLHDALVEHNMAFGSEADDIVALLRFCFTEMSLEKLREVVVHYAACNVEKLWGNEEFRELLESNGSLSRAVIGSMLPRLD